SFNVSGTWFAPLAGMLFPAAGGKVPGLSLLDGSPAAPGGGSAAVLRINPHAKLRLERLFVAAFQPAGAAPADRSIRPVPSAILVRNLAAAQPEARQLSAAEQEMPGGDVTFHDERGLVIDPFAFAAAVAQLLTSRLVLAA